MPNIVIKKVTVEGPVTTNDKMNSGKNENNERVFGLASALQHYSM